MIINTKLSEEDYKKFDFSVQAKAIADAIDKEYLLKLQTKDWVLAQYQNKVQVPNRKPRGLD